MVITGGTLIGAGVLMLVDRLLMTGWLTFLAFPIAGLQISLSGLKRKSPGWLICGLMVIWVGSGLFFMLFEWQFLQTASRIAWSALTGGVIWHLVAFLMPRVSQDIQWWALIPGSIFLAIGAAFSAEPINYLLLACLVITFLGLAFIIWGWALRLFGLLIPGCLLITIGTGVWLAWGNFLPEGSLKSVAIMLGCFAFGWFLIFLVSKRVTPKVAWWALIPGGILAVTSWGLYIGADPANALSFIGNTGSVAVFAFGLYLILMRHGIN